MINLTGRFSMIRLAAAAMLNETPDAKLRWADVDAVLFVGSRFPSPWMACHGRPGDGCSTFCLPIRSSASIRNAMGFF